jgi:hypothetical protein
MKPHQGKPEKELRPSDTLLALQALVPDSAKFASAAALISLYEAIAESPEVQDPPVGIWGSPGMSVG